MTTYGAVKATSSARRIDGEEADVRPPARHRLERLARRVETDQLEPEPEPPRQFARDVYGHAGRLLRRPLRQHRVTQVDGSPQHTGRRQIRLHSRHARDPTDDSPTLDERLTDSVSPGHGDRSLQSAPPP